MYLSDVKKRAIRARRPIAGSPNMSLFYGDPVSPTSEQVGEALVDPGRANEVIADAVVAAAPSEEQAEARLNAFEALPKSAKSEILVLPPLSMSNAVIIVNPVVKGLSANNLNYLFEKAMVEYPSEGRVAVAVPFNPETDPGHYVCALTEAIYGVESGIFAIPFFRFNLSASTLNSRPGGNYTIWVEGVTPTGQTFATKKYSFQRIDSTKAVLGIYIPFSIVATRTLPVLGVFGKEDGAATSIEFTVHVEGMDPQGSEVLTVTHPGYSTAETKAIAELFSLPAGAAL